MKFMVGAEAEIEDQVSRAKRLGHMNLLMMLPVLMIIFGLSLISIAIIANYVGIGGLPGFGARQVALTVSGLAFIAGGVLSLPYKRLRLFSDFLLLGVVTITIILSADLVVLNTGLPSTIDKLVMLVSVIFTIGVIRVLPLFQDGTSVFVKLGASVLAGRKELTQFALISTQLFLILCSCKNLIWKTKCLHTTL